MRREEEGREDETRKQKTRKEKRRQGKRRGEERRELVVYYDRIILFFSYNFLISFIN